MARVARRIIERRRNRLLLFVAKNIGEDGLARLSNNQIADDMGLSVEQVRNASRSLVNDGLLESIPQYLYNGAQVENAYRLTSLGFSRLKASLLDGAPAAAGAGAGAAAGAAAVAVAAATEEAPAPL